MVTEAKKETQANASAVTTETKGWLERQTSLAIPYSARWTTYQSELKMLHGE